MKCKHCGGSIYRTWIPGAGAYLLIHTRSGLTWCTQNSPNRAEPEDTDG